MWNPEDYAKNSDAQLKWAQELRKNIDLSKYRSILDVGCGDGKITADFAVNSALSKVMGIDSSPEMIAYAVQKYPPSQYPNLAFDCVDARKLNFEGQFNLIFSNAVLHWVDNHQTFLIGANRALQDAGKLIISCGGQGNAAEVLEVFAELTTCLPWSVYFSDFYNPYFFYGLQDYKRWLKKSNFAIKRLELVTKDMTHQNREGLAGWIRTTWMPFTKRVPENERENFIAQFVDLYLAKNPLDSQGLTHVSMVRLEVEAYKL